MPLPDFLHAAAFTYDLPDSRIALYPAEPRDRSKLLLYRDGRVDDAVFENVAQHLTPGTLLVANDTAVVNARLVFRTPDNQRVEVFLLEPPKTNWETVLGDTGGTLEFNALVGNRRKWKGSQLVLNDLAEDTHRQLRAELITPDPPFRVRLSWLPGKAPFSELLAHFGKVPLPPYIRRDAEEHDRDTYQTVYAAHAGSVAAPTAGLHFTPRVMQSLEQQGCAFERITLHVGAGTFMPLAADNALDHDMHAEEFSVSATLLDRLAQQISSQQPVVAVGTTSLRTLESLRAMAQQLTAGRNDRFFDVSQWEAYSLHDDDVVNALRLLAGHARKQQDGCIHGKTRLMIVPGFQFKIASAIITNFHQPGSTLLLLVAAFVGDDWKKIYEHALHNEYRFLSYGDSSLLCRS